MPSLYHHASSSNGIAYAAHASRGIGSNNKIAFIRSQPPSITKTTRLLHSEHKPAAFASGPRHATTPIILHSKEDYDRVEEEEEQERQREQHLVLIGGGHAHVQVIKALHLGARPEHLKITLIDAQPRASYSGMVPGCVANYYTPEQTQLDLARLAAWSGMEFVCDAVVDMDLDRKLIYLRNGDYENPIHYDAVSVDIGSTSRHLDLVPGARQFTIPTRPINKLVQRLDDAVRELEEEEEDDEPAPQVVVIGGGAAGIELSLAVISRWKQVRPDTSCLLLHAGDELLPDESSSARQQFCRVMDEKGVRVETGAVVQEITEDRVVLTTGRSVPYTHCLWATGAAAHPLARHLKRVRGLECTDRDWINVEPTLQSTSHAGVFAAGDCAEIQNLSRGPPAKAGVYAVRSGPVLIENLTRYLAGQPLITYEPQDDFLKLLGCGDGEAMGFRFGVAIYGAWVWKLKDHIDQSFMKLFDVRSIPQPQRRRKQNDGSRGDDSSSSSSSSSSYDTAQYDAQDTKHLPSRPSPSEAATLLQRTDAGVDYLVAWGVLRAMAEDASYRSAVLEHVRANDPVVSKMVRV